MLLMKAVSPSPLHSRPPNHPFAPQLNRALEWGQNTLYASPLHHGDSILPPCPLPTARTLPPDAWHANTHEKGDASSQSGFEGSIIRNQCPDPRLRFYDKSNPDNFQTTKYHNLCLYTQHTLHTTHPTTPLPPNPRRSFASCKPLTTYHVVITYDCNSNVEGRDSITATTDPAVTDGRMML